MNDDPLRPHDDGAPIRIMVADSDAAEQATVCSETVAPPLATSNTTIATLSSAMFPFAEHATLEHGPLAYRLAQYPDGRLVLQGHYRIEDTSHGGLFVYGHRFEWRDLPTVVVGTQVEEPA